MNLERLILEKLDLVHPRMLTERVLWNDCRMEEPGTSLTDVKGALRRLEAKDQVTVVAGEDVTRIKITAGGKARLAE